MKSQSQLMLTQLSLHQWYPRKFDAAATAEIARLNGASSDAGRYNKLLVSADSINPLQTRIRQLRKQHYSMTAPWSDNGSRVLPAALYFEYVEMVRDASQEIDVLADEFAFVTYGPERESARGRLGGLFNDTDYPAADVVRSRFGADVEFSPLPNPDDARVWGIGQQAADQIAEEVKTSVETTVKAAQQNVVDQVVQRAQEFIDKVGSYDAANDGKGRLYESALSNLSDVVSLVLRGLNISGDLELDRLAEQLTGALGDTNIAKLKVGEGERRERITEVNKVLSKFEGVFGS